jgi:hypothetical protein
VDAAWLFKTQIQKSPGATGYAPKLKGGKDINLTSELEGCQTVEPLLTLGCGRGRSFLLQAQGGGLCMGGPMGK